MSQFRVIRPAVVRLVGPAKHYDVVCVHFYVFAWITLLDSFEISFLSILFLCYYDMSSFAYSDLLLYMSFYTLVKALIYLVL